jgi:hypothetical protein
LLSIKINADEVISSEDLKTLRKQAIEKNNRGPNPILTKIKDYLLKTTE